MRETGEKERAVSRITAERQGTGKEAASETREKAADQAARKKLKEMNLLDDFLFGSVVTFPEIGERFVKSILKIIFGREFKQLSVTAQKVFYGADSNLHGGRLDVCVEPTAEEEFEGKATVYDIEPDRNNSESGRKALPRRVRFYQGKITMGELHAGEEYDKLKDVFIIMITSYDPFGLGRMMYTIRNQCVEEPEMAYEDGASTVFLYTKGTKGASDDGLRQLLHYMEHSTCENAVNDDLRRIHEMVETVKRDPETSIAYLRLQEKLNRSRKEGEKEGRREGEAVGDLRRLAAMVCKKMKKNQSMERIAEDLVEEIETIEPIYNAAKKFAPEYDTEAVLGEMLRKEPQE